MPHRVIDIRYVSIPSSSTKAPPTILAQIITQHEPYELICEDTGLGLQRSDALVIIQIFQQGRSKETKSVTFAELGARLGAEAGLRGEDLIITCSGNMKEDWSFGMGRAQFLTGEL
jgi:hypothetical protein